MILWLIDYDIGYMVIFFDNLNNLFLTFPYDSNKMTYIAHIVL